MLSAAKSRPFCGWEAGEYGVMEYKVSEHIGHSKDEFNTERIGAVFSRSF
jgi:hypothetical protein